MIGGMGRCAVLVDRTRIPSLRYLNFKDDAKICVVQLSEFTVPRRVAVRTYHTTAVSCNGSS